MTDLSATLRQSKERYAAALLEKSRRRAKRSPRTKSVDLLTWTVLHRLHLMPGVVFDLARHKYLIDLYRETARHVVLIKSGQTGGSEWAISYALHACDERNMNVMYLFPTDTHVSDFSASRISPALEASPYLGRIVVDGSAAGGQRGVDRVTLKRVRDRYLYLRGSRVSSGVQSKSGQAIQAEGAAPQLKSVPADALVYDELDEMDPRAPAIAAKRLGHSDVAEIRTLSTPTYPGRGIHAEWQVSDQREWHVRCGHCGEWQHLTIQQVVLEWDALDRPVSWNGQAEGRAWVACRKCKRELNRLGDGLWVPTHPDVDVAGYHLTKLFSPLVNLLDVVKALQTADETKRKEAFNQDLGEPYTPRGGQLTDDVLDACRRDYVHGVVPGEPVAAGVDVGRVIHCVIRGRSESGERPQRWAGEVDTWDELIRLFRRFQVEKAVVDALPETTKARELQAAFSSGGIWLCYYGLQRIGSKLVEPENWDWANGVVTVDRTRALDETFALFVSGINTLPANARDVRDYYAHLKAPIRVIEDGPGGSRVARYVESGPDHTAHAENYCAIAFDAPVREGEYGDNPLAGYRG